MAKKKTMKKKIMGFLTKVVLPATISVAVYTVMDRYNNDDGEIDGLKDWLGELEDKMTSIQDHLDDEDHGAYERGYLDGVDDHGC